MRASWSSSCSPHGGHQAQPVAAHPLAQPQVEDRGVGDRFAVEQQHGVGELEVAHRRLQAGLGERPQQLERQRARGARVQMRRAQHLAHEAREQQALLACGAAARERADTLPRAAQPGSGLL